MPDLSQGQHGTPMADCDTTKQGYDFRSSMGHRHRELSTKLRRLALTPSNRNRRLPAACVPRRRKDDSGKDRHELRFQIHACRSEPRSFQVNELARRSITSRVMIIGRWPSERKFGSSSRVVSYSLSLIHIS